MIVPFHLSWLLVFWRWFLPLSAWALALGWAWQFFAWRRNLPLLADLSRLALPELPTQTEPHLTVIVPACNEEASIAATLRSLLASEGIRLQIVAVNDRSTDQTGAVMEQIARSVTIQNQNEILISTIEVIHIKELEPGWLGKPHALAGSAKLAKAEWVLFTDGDVLFAPDALRRALAYAIAERADHLVVMPHWLTRTHGEAAMHGAMHALSTWTVRLWRVARPGTRDFLGVGAFNLLRRSTYEALGGFEALRMEVLEDLRLGWLVKRAGYRQRVALGLPPDRALGTGLSTGSGTGLVSVRWARGAWGVVRNLEKNLFALYRYSTALTLLASFGLAAQIAWPLVAIAWGGWSYGAARLAGVLTYAVLAGLYAASRRITGVPAIYVVAFPAAAGLFLFAHLRSLTLALVRGGVVWRGTRYPLGDLRAHAGRFW